MENTEEIKTERTESSAIRASDAGSCSEASEGATDQDPVESRTGGTALIGKEHPSCSQTTENLERLTEKVSSLGLRFPKKDRCGSARKRARKARLAEAPTGASDGGQPQTASGSEQQSLPGTRASAARGGQPLRTRNSQRVGGVPMDRRSDRVRPAALRVTGRLRGPNRLGSLVMPEPLRRASEWLLYAKAILEIKSLGITS